MKYQVTATPGPLPPSPELFDAALDWLQAKLEDGTFDCIYGFLEGGGLSVVNVDSHAALLELMAEYPLFGMVVSGDQATARLPRGRRHGPRQTRRGADGDGRRVAPRRVTGPGYQGPPV